MLQKEEEEEEEEVQTKLGEYPNEFLFSQPQLRLASNGRTSS